MSNKTNAHEKPEFILELIRAYSTFQEGKPKPIPYVVQGLLTQGGFSILAAKPKQGKSCLSRYEAVCVAKGIPFLGRETTKGGVILISLEDPRHHVDNCLRALGYDPETDAPIHIIEKLPSTMEETIRVLKGALAQIPDVRLIVVDTMAKLLRVKDLNEYMPVMNSVEQLRNLAREFDKLHIQGIAHCKKVQTDDPFDSLLGSTALRGETDTNIALFQQKEVRFIAAETRIGTAIIPSILEAELTESQGATVVKEFSLGGALDMLREEKREKQQRKQQVSYEDRIIQYLQEVSGTAKQEELLKKVVGKRKSLLETLEHLESKSVVSIAGIPRSPIDPLTVTLNADELETYRMGAFGQLKALELGASAQIDAKEERA